MLNPALNIAQLQQAYRQQQALAIQNVLLPDVAQRIHAELQSLDWVLEINDYDNGTPRLRIPLREVRNPQGSLLNVLDEVPNHIRRDRLFYMRLNVDGTEFTTPALSGFSTYLNSDEFLSRMRELG